MRLAGRAAMRQIDERTIREFGIPALTLMEMAGEQVAAAVQGLLPSLAGHRVSVVCGRGNNGGDGLVAARYLHNRGARVRAFVLPVGSEWTDDAAWQRRTADRWGLEVLEVEHERDWEKLSVALHFSDAAVDALLGVGMAGDLSSIAQRGVSILNEASCPKVAVDMPSGLCADTGRRMPVAVRSTVTVTLGAPKPGLYIADGPDWAGRVVVADIGHPTRLLEQDVLRHRLTTAAAVAAMLPDRPRRAHKGTSGRVVGWAGSRGMTGAAVLAARGAHYAGAGLVTLGAPPDIQPLLAVQSAETMVRPLGDTVDRLDEAGFLALANLLAEADGCFLGPGLGRDPLTVSRVRAMMAALPCPAVLDADALFALADGRELLRAAPMLCVLTPHPGEFARLSGHPLADILADPLGSASSFAEDCGVVVVLKGAPTVVAFPDGETWINTTGNPGMATGGMGDVLTGCIAALIGQGMPPAEAAVAGVYIHGLAADRLAMETPTGFTAGDVARELPRSRAGLPLR